MSGVECPMLAMWLTLWAMLQHLLLNVAITPKRTDLTPDLTMF